MLTVNGEQVAFFIEYDRNTEDLGGSARITIEKKLKHIQTIWKQRLYEKYFNFDRAMVLFVCTLDEDQGEKQKDRRMHHIMRKVRETIGESSYLLFQSVRDYERALQSVRPSLAEGEEGYTTEHLFDAAWQRVGYPPFDLKTLRDAY
jgi:hypothetical protein